MFQNTSLHDTLFYNITQACINTAVHDTAFSQKNCVSKYNERSTKRLNLEGNIIS